MLEAGAVQLVLETKVRQLLIEHGEVTGSAVEHHGVRILISSDMVVLATGGYANNRFLRASRKGSPLTAVWLTSIAMVLIAGAALAGQETWLPTWKEPE